MNKVQVVAFAIYFVNILSSLISYAIIARIVLSWFSNPMTPKGRVLQFLNDVTEPVVNVFRKIPHRAGMIDFAPLIALIGVDLLSALIVQLLSKLIV